MFMRTEKMEKQNVLETITGLSAVRTVRLEHYSERSYLFKDGGSYRIITENGVTNTYTSGISGCVYKFCVQSVAALVNGIYRIQCRLGWGV